ncbi:MAG TPA: SMC-Scp complex subunit ScpB [Thermoanaerobaculia bacterium]|nr:SMC-Scp complex subunit ScpB [Thermoanaerobaculia bacterium]
MTSREELEAAIEAILFVATEPVTSEKLHALFAEDEREAVEAALAAVIARYPGEAAQGLVADFAAGGVRLVTRPALQGYLRKYFQVSGRTKLSMAALETLAIVAYRQPITAPEIQELRGVSPAGVLKTLLDHRLVRIAGRKEVVGKPFLYCTSREFLIRFGLNRLQDLPPLEELEQMLASHAERDSGDTAEQADLFPSEEAEEKEADERAAEVFWAPPGHPNEGAGDAVRRGDTTPATAGEETWEDGAAVEVWTEAERDDGDPPEGT